MLNVQQLLACDLDQVFADWGESATLLEVRQQYNVESGQMSETTFASPISVLRGEDRPQLIGEISATLSLTHRLVLVRSETLPDLKQVERARLLFEETPYEIRTARESNQAGLVVLECVRNTIGDSSP